MDWLDIRDLSNISGDLLQWVDSWASAGLVYVLAGVIGIIAILVFLIPSQLATVWIERRLIGRFQVRRGPNRVGPFGLLQPLADALKVLTKESLTPRHSDHIVFWLAPILIFIPAITVYAVLPFGKNMMLANLNVGLLFVVALGSINTVTVFMAGWSSNNKYSLLGAMRTVAMVVSYEVPQVMALLGVVLFVGNMSLNDAVLWQADRRIPLVLIQPLSFIFFFIASLVELNRTPADIAEAESEIVAGYHTEYSGFKFSLFYAAEYTAALAVSGILATLYFGGWWFYGLDKWVPGWLIFIGKLYFFFAVMVWLRGTLPRLRIDQLMGFGWKVLVPLSLVNIFIAGLEVLLWQEQDLPAEAVIPIFSAINIALAAALVVAWARLIFRGRPSHVRLVRTVGHVLAETQA